MSSKNKKPSLAEKISNLVTAAPTNFNSDDEEEATKAKVVDHYSESDSDDVGLGTSFRKQNVDLLDQVDDRYKGKKVSRKDIYEEKSSDEEIESEILENSDEETSGRGSEDGENDEDVSDDDDDDDDDNDDDDDQSGDGESFSDDQDDLDFDESNPLRRDRDTETNFQDFIPKNVHDDIEKGNCVRGQLKLWENLLEMRIQLQKCLITSNKMPQFDVYKDFRPDNHFSKSNAETKNNLTNLLDNLLDMQDKLLKNNPETKNLLSENSKGKNKEVTTDDPMDEEICSDTEDEEEKEVSEAENGESDDEHLDGPSKKKRKTLAEYEKILENKHNIYRPHRNSVIQKWNDKTRVATGSVSKGTNQAVVKQIEFVLNDKQKIIKRTQLKRSEYEIVGKVAQDETDEDGRRTQEYDTEIYDDDDFYHQLLRELIEHKSADITDPIQLSKQWIQLQNMRNKMKRKIDTRATKGRRVRYNVHTKLINFMAPDTTHDSWSDLAKNELYNSLFGKIKVVENPARNIVEI